MINGRPCGSKPPASENETQRAVTWTRNGLFGFVGDTDQWDRSICVFVGLYPPRYRYDYNFSLLFRNARPSRQKEIVSRAKSILLRHAAAERDPDTVLFREAQSWLDRTEPHLKHSPLYQRCRAAMAARATSTSHRLASLEPGAG